MPSFLVQTLGCKLNQLESESVIDAFSKAGFEQPETGNIDIIIVNTCTVTSKADQKARRVIRKALRDYPNSRVLVTGCYAQLNKDDILTLDTGNRQRLFVINKDSILNLPEYIDKLGIENEGLRNLNSKSVSHISKFQFNPERFSSHTRSLLKIQDGCDNHCTYCKIRLARGPSISLERDEILSRLLVLEQSHSEAALTGVNICQYKSFGILTTNHTNHLKLQTGVRTRTEEGNLADLLSYLLSGTEKIAIRLSSLAPERVDENLAKILSNKRIRPHFHLSIQSGSAKILEKMGRTYNAEIVEKAAGLLRRAKDDPFLACDIITGFPGETEEEFNKTLELCEKIDFAWIHVFPYSKRAGTPAFSFTDTVHDKEISKRVQILTNLAWQGRAFYVKRWLGREVDVLIENSKRETLCRGISENYLKLLVRCNGKIPPPGTVLRCKLTEQGNLKDYDISAQEV